jgi:hypothetical protein
MVRVGGPWGAAYAGGDLRVLFSLVPFVCYLILIKWFLLIFLHSLVFFEPNEVGTLGDPPAIGGRVDIYFGNLIYLYRARNGSYSYFPLSVIPTHRIRYPSTIGGVRYSFGKNLLSLYLCSNYPTKLEPYDPSPTSGGGVFYLYFFFISTQRSWKPSAIVGN